MSEQRAANVAPEPSDPLHQRSGPTTAWTTVNTAEALPGVLMPLGWTFWNEPCERGMWGAFCDIGILSPSQVRVAPSVDERYSAAFFGRYAANIDQLRAMVDLMPGTSADAFEEQLLGAVHPGATSNPSRRRYPIVFVKLPRAALRLPRQLGRMRSDIEAWWSASVAPGALGDAGAARAAFADAMARFEQVMRPHAVATLLAQALYDQVAKLAVAAGRPGLEIRLITGYGAIEETELAADLWHVSRGGMDLAAFLARHGYHGRGEGEISNPSWREDRGPLEVLAATYRSLDEAASPRVLEARRATERGEAEQELLGALARSRRGGARVVLRAARRYIPLREVGKAAFLQTIDVARAAARVVGGALTTQGVLEEPEDVFYLTAAELLGALPDDPRSTVAFRRERRRHYQRLRLPDSWVGMPDALPLDTAPVDREDATVTGLAVSPGVVEAAARVVLDPLSDELEPGEILVCQTTDPSWAALFVVAAGLVIDIGGPLSHGAIVARELGIPCVINTGTGTARIGTGDRVRLDGDAGTVEVLSRVSTPERVRQPG